MNLLGIDAGFAKIGWSAVKLQASPADQVDDAKIRLGGNPDKVLAMGLIRTAPSAKKRKVLAAEDNVRRIREIRGELVDLRGRWHPHAICCETMSFPRNASSAAKMAMFWGALIVLAEEWAVPIIQASPQEIKLACCGAKNASKEDVEAALRKKYYGTKWATKLKSMPAKQRDHAFDSLGAIVACLDSEVVRMMRSILRTRG